MNLLINAILYIVTFLIARKKTGLSPFTFVWGVYSFIAIGGYVIVQTGLYEEAFNINTSSDVDLLPYLFNYYCMFILSIPLLKIPPTRIESLKLPKKLTDKIPFIMCLFAVLAFIRLLELSLYGNMNFSERHYQITQEGEGISLAAGNKLFGLFISLLSYIHKVCYPFVLLYIVYALKKSNMSFLKVAVWVALCLSPSLIGYYTSGNRAGMFFMVLNLFFFFILFFKQLSFKQRRNTLLLGTILGMILLSFSMSISEERFSHNDIGTVGSILRYFGEDFPNLGYQFWEKTKSITFGARQFTDYYSIIFNKEFDYQGFDERFAFWSFITGVDCALFKTLFGDLYIEFGTVGALIFCTLLSFGIYLFVKKHPFKLYWFPIYFTYYCFCVNMVLDIPIIYTSTSCLKTLILMYILGLYLKRINVKSINQNE